MPGSTQKDRIRQVAAAWQQYKAGAKPAAKRGRGIAPLAKPDPAPQVEQSGGCCSPANGGCSCGRAKLEQAGEGLKRRKGGVSKAKKGKKGKKKVVRKGRGDAPLKWSGGGQAPLAWSGGGAAPLSWSGGSMALRALGNGNSLPRPSQTGLGFAGGALTHMGYGFRGDPQRGGSFWGDIGDAITGTAEGAWDGLKSGVNMIGDTVNDVTDNDDLMRGVALAGNAAPIAALFL